MDKLLHVCFFELNLLTVVGKEQQKKGYGKIFP